MFWFNIQGQYFICASAKLVGLIARINPFQGTLRPPNRGRNAWQMIPDFYYLLPYFIEVEESFNKFILQS